MAEIHVQARKHRYNPVWMWTWIILGILIIAAIVYFVYVNKNKNDQNDRQDIQNQRNTPISRIDLPQQFANVSYVLSTNV